MCQSVSLDMALKAVPLLYQHIEKYFPYVALIICIQLFDDWYDFGWGKVGLFVVWFVSTFLAGKSLWEC